MTVHTAANPKLLDNNKVFFSLQFGTVSRCYNRLTIQDIVTVKHLDN